MNSNHCLYKHQLISLVTVIFMKKNLSWVLPAEGWKSVVYQVFSRIGMKTLALDFLHVTWYHLKNIIYIYEIAIKKLMMWFDLRA